MATHDHRISVRGVTLVEVLIVLVVVSVLYGAAALGTGFVDGARLRRSSMLIASAVRVAYGHANASSRTVRLAFNFEGRSVAIEEATEQLALAKNERSGGAAPATAAEHKAIEEADEILKGPRAPRPLFLPAKVTGFQSEMKNRTVKTLERNIRFLQIETAHQDEPVKTDQAYLYFWPGGQTERAALQLTIAGSYLDADTSTILVSPLTGKAEIRKGRLSMPRPRDDVEESERKDTGF
jgi:general secretion pathway protein H